MNQPILKTLIPFLRIVFGIVLALHVAAVLILLFEQKDNNDQFNSFGDALWWAIVTMTTVDYGDKYPTTNSGRLVAGLLMYGSIILVSFFTATVSTVFIARKIQEGKGLEAVKFKRHTLICGWNADTPKVLEALNHIGQSQVVLVNEMPAETMENYLSTYKNLELRFVKGNFAREPILDRANVAEAAAVIILPDASLSTDFEKPDDIRTLEATIAIKDMADDVKVYAHVIDEERVANLKRANIDDVIVSDEHTGYLLASHVISPGTPQVLQELLLCDSEHQVRRVEIPATFVGQRFDVLFDYFRREESSILIGYLIEDEGFRLEDTLSGGNVAITDFITCQVQQAGISTTTRGQIRVHLNPPGDELIEEGISAIVIV